jgi:nitrogen-specific signal transduction histidine kinase
MTHEELQKLRERLLQSTQQQRPRSRLQKILDRILKRVNAMVESEEKQPQPVSQSDD